MTTEAWPQSGPKAPRYPLGLSTPDCSGAADHGRPQANAESGLETCDGRNVGPAFAPQDVSDRCVGDARPLTHLPEAERSSHIAQGDGNAPRDLSGDVVRGDLRPVGDKVAGARSLGRHAPRLRLETTTPLNERRLTSSVPSVIASFTSCVGVSHQSPRLKATHDVNEAIDAFRPSLPGDRWGTIAAFVQDAARDAGLQRVDSARNLLTILAQYVDWAHRVCGVELDRSKIFTASRIAEYTATRLPHLERSTAGNYRSRLVKTAEALNPSGVRARMKPLPPSRGVPPYSAGELKELWVWAYGQPRECDRRDAIVLLAGCLGAGLTGREACDLLGRDVHIDEVGVLLDVSGVRPRQVPVLAEMARHFIAAMEDTASDAFVFHPQRKVTAKNTASNFVQRCAPSGPPLSTQRTRATWLVGHLRNGVPIQAVMKAMGIDDFSAIARYLDHVPDLAADDYRAALGGTREST
jgi:hypothetical protein